MIVSKFRAAAESFVRTFAQAFVGALALIQFANVDLTTLKATLVAAGGAAVSAGLAAALRALLPLQTDSQSVGVKGVKGPQTGPGGDPLYGKGQ